MTHKFYSVRALSAPRTAEVFIFGDIGENWFGESVAASEFVKEFSQIPADYITVRISSYGGSVSDGIAIYNAIKRHDAHITVTIESVAASIASLIAMAGDSIEMPDNTLLMVHAPWGGASGNAAQLREYADFLDTWAEAMAASYASKTGRPVDEMRGLLTDGVDHWYTAQQALDAGFIDVITTSVPVAAALDLSRYSSRPAAAAAFMKQEKTTMTATKDQAAPEAQATAAIPALNEADIRAKALADDARRRSEISASFKPFMQSNGVSELLMQCHNDPSCSKEAAHSKLLETMAKGVGPAAGTYAVVLEDERDKFRSSAVSSIMARASVGGVKMDISNPFRAYSLMDMAKECLAKAGVSTVGLDKMGIVKAAFTQSTSDFPILLENAMRKTLQNAYAIQADSWRRFCAVGSVSDFRAHPRYRVGSLGNLDSLNELGEFKNKTIRDGEKASISIGTKGNIINVSRQAIVNDDLGIFLGNADMLGRAAARTIEAAVYSLLAQNGGLGPTLGDGLTLFHATHGNIGATGAMTVTTIDDARQKMASQKDVSGNDFLDLRPAVLLCSLASGGNARIINGSEYDPNADNKLQRPNMVRGLFSDVVDSPRLTGTRFYMFSDPGSAPVIEVAFLDGEESPVIEQEEGFEADGIRMKVRHDHGIAAVDYRGATTSAGA